MTTFESYEQGTPSWVDLSTTDQSAAKDFYAGLFGWTFDDRPMPDGSGDYSMALLDGHTVGAVTGQTPQAASAGAPPTWNVYLAVDDVASAAKDVTAAGGTVLVEPFAMGDSGHLAWVADPSGAQVGLWQGERHIGATLANVPGTVTWNELVTSDADAALPFYDKVLGLSSATEPLGPDYTYTTFSVGERSVAGSTPPMSEDVPNHWNVWFATADVEATVATSASLGGSVLVSPRDMPVGRMAVVRDPQGAVISLLQPGEPLDP